MDAAKAKKLQDYASFLAKQAESKEQQGNSAEAARDYVKLVDILLLLANEAKDHPTWQQMISRAEYYQKKVKALGSSSDQAQKFSTSDTSQSIARDKGVELPAPPQSRASPDPAGSPSSLLKSFRKIPGLMGKNNASPEIQKLQTPEVSVSSETRSSAPATWMSEFPKTSPSFESKDQAALAASPSYAEVIAENERLKARIVTLESNEQDYATAFE